MHNVDKFHVFSNIEAHVGIVEQVFLRPNLVFGEKKQNIFPISLKIDQGSLQLFRLGLFAFGVSNGSILMGLL